MSSVSSTTSSTTTTTLVTTTTTAVLLPIIAWQPSHQDDTGDANWHEWVVCGDIVKRVMVIAPGFTHVLAWQTDMGLWGSNNNGGTNQKAFDSELAMVNEAGAGYFISVHNDGAAPSGVMGMHFAGDELSAQFATALAKGISARVGLPLRDTRGTNLYSLDPIRNKAPIRVLLEIGDNVGDRELLEDPDGRARIAAALAETLQVAIATTNKSGE